MWSSLSCIFSMLVATRRRDDDLFAKVLSFVGWYATFVSRITLFSICFVVIGEYFIIGLVCHVLCFSVWIYCIAIESYRKRRVRVNNCKRMILALIVFLFFGIPSLMLWPILFDLKESQRTTKYLLITIIENLFLIFVLFVCSEAQVSVGQTYVTPIWILASLIGFTLIGPLFLSLYLYWKPSLTDQVARHNMLCEKI